MHTFIHTPQKRERFYDVSLVIMKAEKPQSALCKLKTEEKWKRVSKAYERNGKCKFQFKSHGLRSNSTKNSGTQLCGQPENNSTFFQLSVIFWPSTN